VDHTSESRFLQAVKKLGPEEVQRFDKAIKDLTLSEEPTKMGRPKKGVWHGYYSYDLGRSHRLIYRVFPKEKIIQIAAIGDHKQVYGKD
jgi:addiction module RelE/StbE family toxin